MSEKKMFSLVDLDGLLVWEEETQPLQVSVEPTPIYHLPFSILMVSSLPSKRSFSQQMKWLLYQVDRYTTQHCMQHSYISNTSLSFLFLSNIINIVFKYVELGDEQVLTQLAVPDVYYSDQGFITRAI